MVDRGGERIENATQQRAGDDQHSHQDDDHFEGYFGPGHLVPPSRARRLGTAARSTVADHFMLRVFQPNVSKADLTPIGPFVVALIERELQIEDLPLDTFGSLLRRGADRK